MNKSARGGSKAPLRTAFDDACRSLARRRLTEQEIRQRLVKRHSQKDIDKAVAKLTEYRYLDDNALIIDYIKDRMKLSPRSAKLMEFELSRRGIEAEHFRKVFEDEFPEYDEVEVARRALASRLKRLKASKPQGRRERALRFLHTRGFSYEVMQEVWEEADREDNLEDGEN